MSTTINIDDACEFFKIPHVKLTIAGTYNCTVCYCNNHPNLIDKQTDYLVDICQICGSVHVLQ